MRLVLLLVIGCAPQNLSSGDPDVSLFRDFLSDGKFDQAGHPVNAVTLQAESVCQGNGTRLDLSFLAGSGEACRVALAPRAFGSLIVNVRLRSAPARGGEIARISVVDGDTTLATRTLTRSQVRKAGAWMHLAVPFQVSQGQLPEVRLEGRNNGQLDVDYFELFPSQFQLVVDPGSKEYGPGERLVFERSLSGAALSVSADGMDLTARLQHLLVSGRARQTTTSFRRLVSVAVDLLGMLPAAVQVAARAGNDSVRVEVRSRAPDCEFEGDIDGKKVLLTGFQPFPANAAHENISWVAVSSLDPLALPGVQVMRLRLPVEYDLAAAEIASAVERCQPDLVVSFGQGGGSINLEETAYNLKDTAEIAGGVPDNRGVVFAGQPIDESAPESRATGLPLDRIRAALEDLGESPRLSDDPGRYICNNVFFAGVGVAEQLGIPAGFVHLPYEDQFPEATRARWGRVVETVVRAAF